MRNYIYLILLISSAVFSSVEKAEYSPASIKNSRMSLERLIKFPKSVARSKKDVAVVVRCDAFVKRNGKLSSNICYEGGDVYYPYVTAINRSAKRAALNPGRVNGTARVVYFQYYVVFMKKDKSTSVEVVGNSGLEVEKYGANYTSPQRYRESSGNFGAGCGFNKKITVNAVVSKLGLVTEVDIIGDGLGKKCVKYLENSFKGQAYIPAHYNGKPIRSFYSERIFNVMREQ